MGVQEVHDPLVIIQSISAALLIYKFGFHGRFVFYFLYDFMNHGE